nr:uncharacterized protein LOC127347936 [Lolium perenne]
MPPKRTSYGEQRRFGGGGGKGRQGSWGSRGSDQGSDGPSWRRNESLSKGSGSTEGGNVKEGLSTLMLTNGGKEKASNGTKEKLEVAVGRENLGSLEKVPMTRVENEKEGVVGGGRENKDESEGMVNDLQKVEKKNSSSSQEAVLVVSDKSNNGTETKLRKYKRVDRAGNKGEKKDSELKLGIKRQGEEMETDESPKNKKAKEMDVVMEEGVDLNQYGAGLSEQPCMTQ